MARSIFSRKPIDQIISDSKHSQLKRSLTAKSLISLGIGAIIGAGIFVMTGDAAANYAGPGVIISFVLAGLVCAVAGLCYAELASTLPVSGSAYTYAYGTLGEVFAWSMGWLLLLEYGIAASTVAAGWTGYLSSIFADFGIHLPDAITKASFVVKEVTNADGTVTLVAQMLPQFNLVGALGILAVTALLVVGVSESAKFTNFAVLLKVSVLLIFIAIGLFYINGDNWTPFIPEHVEGTPWNKFGWAGVAYASTIIFFAYVGFEAVSTAAGEAQNPQKDLPMGILGSLVICTIIYMLVAAVLTGVVSYKELGVSAPIAVAIDAMNPTWAQISWPFGDGTMNLLTLLIKVGAIMGLSSVMLALCFAQTRVFYQMSNDGLVPSVFGRVHPKFQTPAAGTTLLGVLIAIAAAVLPLNLLGALVSLGTAAAFGIVCISVLYLRKTAPNIERPFKVPFFPALPIIGVILCLGIIGLIFLDKITSLQRGNWVPITLLFSYFAIGGIIYWVYGSKKSKLRQE